MVQLVEVWFEGQARLLTFKDQILLFVDGVELERFTFDEFFKMIELAYDKISKYTCVV